MVGSFISAVKVPILPKTTLITFGDVPLLYFCLFMNTFHKDVDIGNAFDSATRIRLYAADQQEGQPRQSAYIFC
jgi:hypothetical protein